MTGIDQYDIGKLIGRGGYGSVWIAIHKQTKEKFAVKIYEKSWIADLQRWKCISNEIEIL